NGVRMRFYQLLAMQRLLDVRAELLKVAEEAVTTTEELVNVGAANEADQLQARIEARQQRGAPADCRRPYATAWQRLAACRGAPPLRRGAWNGDLKPGRELPRYDPPRAHLREARPKIRAARAQFVRAQFPVRREQVEPIPNVNLRVSTGYNFQEPGVTTTVQAGIRLPVFDRNQGNVRAAQAELARAQAEVCRVELSLRQRLAKEYARYQTARAGVEAYRTANLPEAKRAYELYLASFRARRAAWPQVLVAQRTYFQISVDYYEALEELRRAEVAILGLLLVDGLSEPPGVGGE